MKIKRVLLNIIVLVLLMTGFSFTQPSAQLLVYYIDVGMGDAIFLDIPPKDCMLIDGGSLDPYGIDSLIAFLKAFFEDPDHEEYKRTIDVVVASHQHEDHVEGLLKLLKTDLKVSRYFDNGIYNKSCKVTVGKINKLIRERNINHYTITDKLIETQGTRWTFTNDKLDPFDAIDVYAIGGATSPVDKKPNNNSIVLRVNCGDVSFLFPGDAEEKEEDRIVSRLKSVNNLVALDVDVFKACHHGSKTSNTEEFLKAITPKISVISVGDGEISPKSKQFRLPKESSVRRMFDYTSNRVSEPWSIAVYPDKKPLKGGKMEKPKIIEGRTEEVYCTSSDGTIIIKVIGNKIEAESMSEGNDY